MSSVSTVNDRNSLVQFVTNDPGKQILRKNSDLSTLLNLNRVCKATHSVFKDYSEGLKDYRPLVEELFTQKDDFTQGELPFIATFIATEQLDLALKVVKMIKNPPTQPKVIGRIAEKYIDIDPQQIERILSELLDPWGSLHQIIIIKVLKKLALTNLKLAKEIVNRFDSVLLKCWSMNQKFQIQAAHEIAFVNPESADALSLLNDLRVLADTHPEIYKAPRLVDIAKVLYLIDEEKSKQVWSEAITVCKQITYPKIKKETLDYLVRELVRCFPEKVLEVTNQVYPDDVEIASTPEKKVLQIIEFSEKCLAEFPQAQAIFSCKKAVKFHSTHPDYPQGAIDLLCYAENCIDKLHDRSNDFYIEILKKIAKLNPDKAVKLMGKLKNETLFYNVIRFRLYLIHAKSNSSPDLAFSIFKNRILSIFKNRILCSDQDLDYETNYRIAKGTFQIFCQNNDKILKLALKFNQVCKTAILLEALDHWPNQKLHQYVTDRLVGHLKLQ